MKEAEKKTRPIIFRKPSLASLIAAAMTLGLVFSGFLLPHPGDAKKSPEDFSAQVTAVHVGSAAEVDQPSAEDIDAMVAQLQATQARLQGVSALLEQKSQAFGDQTYTSSQPSGPAQNDLPEIWAEIDQLYQVMQPLMVQLEVASQSQSSRPVSELIALRTRINTIHQRLAFLLARVEAAGGSPGVSSGSGMKPGTSHGEPPADSVPADQATIEALYTNLAELQNLLYQMQRQNAGP